MLMFILGCIAGATAGIVGMAVLAVAGQRSHSHAPPKGPTE